MTDALQNEAGANPTDTPPGRVYLDFYKLTEAPFAITPDPEFLFSSSCHQQVLDKVSYAIESRMGFFLLTGEVGTGKTTLCRTLLDRLSGQAQTVYVINPSITGQELLASILEDLGVNPEPHATKKALIDQLNQRLLCDDAGYPVVVIIDDAQTMTPEALEDLRLLSNLETDKRKLIQVVLSGQPELLDKLSHASLRQLKQRIAVHCRLDPLSTQETDGYISRRLFVAGNKGQVSFSDAAMRLIHKTSGGIPRLINKICDYALTAGYVCDDSAIGPPHVKRALAELGGLDFRAPRKASRLAGYGLAAAVIVLLALMAVSFFDLRTGPLPPLKQHRPLPLQGAVNPLSPASSSPQPMPSVPAPVPATVDPRPEPGEMPSRKTADAVTAAAFGLARLAEDSSGPTAPSSPYALQLGSFRTREQAERGVAQYLKKGVATYWQAVGNGQWYRIITGKFQSKEAADRYRTDHALDGAMIVYAPWTVRVLPKHPDVPDSTIRRFLSEIGYDSLMETGNAGDNVIYTGLFLSIEAATRTAEKINSSNRSLAQVVSR
ncbi:MAG: AAA family ATPase [Desulfosarcina sp.]|nr:AAA family ATPase [Desulfosarcina sp.]MBC2742812.1 AAA family ATPase [Desulfosarcina sp.]MBC2765722.1 AAA family ATPase [Desulfosarcina sp.]